ncbi:MAG: hypothetical protein ACUVSK_12355 [Desulfotomaculales bacterium]
MFIAWKPVKKKYYPYLQCSDWVSGRVKTEAVYLGMTLEAAEATLQKLNLPEEEKRRLIEELHRKQPKHPPTTQVEKKAVRQLRRIAKWYGTSKKVQEAVTAALAILEGGKGNG